MSPTDTAKVEHACREIAEAGDTVTFAQVAGRVGVSRTTLYRRTELKAIIEEHRVRGREAHTLAGLATQIEHLRHSLEAVAANVRRHEETLRRLKPKPESIKKASES